MPVLWYNAEVQPPRKELTMSLKPMTGDEMMMAIESARKTMTADKIKENIDLKIAADFNSKRKSDMIVSLQQLYRYLHGDGKRPDILASDAFDPSKGVKAPNIYYCFKEIKKGMPWEIRRDYFVEPIALTLVMLDMANSFFPCPEVSNAIIIFQGFVNIITRPVKRPGLSAAEEAAKRADYMRKIERFEEQITDMYRALSVHFAELENPDRNPVAKAVLETDKRTEKMARKMKLPGKNKVSFKAQNEALALWNEYRHNPCVAAKAGKRKAAFVDVFDFAKHRLTELGFECAEAFKEAVKAAQKRKTAR